MPIRPRRKRVTTERGKPADLADQTIALDATAEEETGPYRRCVLSRVRLPKEQMVRFVLSPERMVLPDLSASLPGRGIWLSARRDVLETARAQGTLAKAFARAARGPVTVPPDLTSVLQAALMRRISERLGLARRAGQAVAGFEKAREWLRAGRARLIVQAADGSAAERARFLAGAAPQIAVLTPLPAASLGRIFGRDHVVHVAVAGGGLAETIAMDAKRLAGLAGQGESGQDDRKHASGAVGGQSSNKRTGA